MHLETRASTTSDQATWALIVLIVAGFMVAQPQHRLVVDAKGALLLGIVLVMLAVLCAAAAKTGMARLTMCVTGFQQMVLFSLAGVAWSYAAAAQGGPLRDADLAALDAGLGLDWTGLLAMLDLPIAAAIVGLAYYSLIPQMVVLIVGLAALRRFAVLRTVLFASVLSGAVSILISAQVPAAGNLFDLGTYTHLWPSAAHLHQSEVTALRAGTFEALDFTAAKGIVTFPSYHGALGLIYIWAFAQVRVLRWPGGLWAGSTILATPVGGGHYVVDVLAGLAIAALSLLLARYAVHVRLPLPAIKVPHRHPLAA